MQSTQGMQSAGIRVRVSDLLFALQKRWAIIVALSLIGAAFGLILSAMTYVQSSSQSYNVSGSFAVTTINGKGLYLNDQAAPNYNDFHMPEDMIDFVFYIIKSDHVMDDVINRQDLLGYGVRDLKSTINLSQYNATQIVEMSLNWRIAEEGIAIWNAIIDSTNRTMLETLEFGKLAVINEAQAELVNMMNGGSRLPIFLTVLGFAAGVGYAVVELLMRPTLNNVRDVETMFGLETIGVIPQDNSYYKKKGSLLVQDDSGSSAIVQSFSAAAYILRNRLSPREKHLCFYVTSAISQEGKTTVAANLAIQLSDMEQRTLLIDFDTRNPSLGALFLDKVEYAHSLNALYHGDATEEEAIITLTGYLDLLPTVLEHNMISLDGNIIELIEKLRQKYDYVILDAPPVGIVSDTLSLNQVASSALFVIGYDKSSIPEIQSSLEKLDKSGIRLVGCMVNGVQSVKNLGFANSTDDHKQSIMKKAKDKMKEREKTAFFDQSKGNDVLDEMMEGGNAPSEGKESSPDKAGAKTKKKDKQKEQRRGKKQSPAQEEQKAENKSNVSAAPPRSQNIFEDLMDKEDSVEKRDDQDTLMSLLNLGITNEFGDNNSSGKSDGSTDEPQAAEQIANEADELIGAKKKLGKEEVNSKDAADTKPDQHDGKDSPEGKKHGMLKWNLKLVHGTKERGGSSEHAEADAQAKDENPKADD